MELQNYFYGSRIPLKKKLRTTFIVKTHSVSTEDFASAVLIIRNPLENAIADFHRWAGYESNLASWISCRRLLNITS